MRDVSNPTDDELVAAWFRANAELHRRGVKLWHAGDFAELLVAAAIGGTRAPSNVQRGYDLIAPDRTRWQVKALVTRPGNTRTSIGFLRPDTFDVLAVVLFGERMETVQAWRIPADVVPDYGRWYEDRGAYRLTRTKKLTSDPRVATLDLVLPLGIEDE